MSFTSFEFLCFGVVAIALMRVTPPGLTKRLLILALNALFVASFAQRLSQLVPLLGFVIAGFAAIQIVAKFKGGTILAALVITLVAAFIWLKQYVVLGLVGIPTTPMFTIGLSYILFRVLHLLIDVSEGAAEPPSVLDYLAYVFFFLNFVSGPIQRYESFQGEVSKTLEPSEFADVNHAFHRILLGYFMVVVISSAATGFMHLSAPFLTSALQAHAMVGALRIYSLMVAMYLVNMYANFAGYMHIVIGVGALAGFQVAENFDHPFIARNFSDFWARWHMTLTNWFRAYLFNPLLRVLAGRWHKKSAAPYIAATAFFATFLVMGVWHGSTYQFIVYGIMLGTGATVHRLWQHWMAQFLGKTGYKALCNNGIYYQFSRSLTLSYFAVCMTCIWIDDAQFSTILSGFGAVVVTCSLLGLTIVGMTAGAIWDSVPSGLSAVDGKNQNQSTGWAPLRLIALLSAAVIIGGGTDLALLAITGVAGGGSRLHVLGTALMASAFLVSTLIAMGALDGDVAAVVRLQGKARTAEYGMAGWMGLRIFVIVTFIILLSSAVPQFIYRAF